MSRDYAVDEQGRVGKKRPAEKEQAPAKVDPKLPPLHQMQQTVGNTAVQRLIQRQGSGPTELDEATADSIQQKRGGGQKIDGDVAAQAGQVMGQDLSGVNVHTNGEADQLNKQLGAKAFTVGNDIFFRDGAYAPQSSDGQRLIAHELTHVVQQGAATPAVQGATPTVQGKMMVNDPNDQYEVEADQVADTVMNSVQRQEEDEKVQLQAEEDEDVAQMQEMDEEETVE